MINICTLVGDFYHNHDDELVAIKNALDLLDFEYKLMDLDINNIGDYINDDLNLFILGKENRINPNDEIVNVWLSEKLENQICSYVSNGGKILVMHSGLSSYGKDSKMVDMVKGYFLRHPKMNTYVDYKTIPNNLLDEKYSFTLFDEHYFVEVDKENTEIFLECNSLDGYSFAGWHHNYNKGKVICITPTHNKSGFEDKDFIDFLSNAIKKII